MRLIDADELEMDADWDYHEDGFTAYSRSQIENAPTFPENSTNGDVIKTMFHIEKILVTKDELIGVCLSKDWTVWFEENWWNAPYMK